MRLQTRFAVFLVVVVACVVTAISFVNYSDAIRLYLESQSEELEVIAESSMSAANRLAQSEGEESAVRFLREVDEARPRTRILFAAWQGNMKDLDSKVRVADDKTNVFVDTALLARGLPVRSVRFERVTQNFAAFARSQVIKHVVIGVFAAGAASVLLVGFLNLHVVRPVSQLAGLAEDASRGLLNRRSSIRRGDEVGTLAESFNRMLDAIVDARDEGARQNLERLRALEALRTNDRERTVDHLAAEFAHELGSPLNVVQGRAEMILEAVSADSPAHGQAKSIIEQAARMTQIIQRRVGRSHKNAPVRTQQPVADVVHRAETLLEPILNDRGVRLRFVEEPDVRAFFDAERLLQVMSNLILTSCRTSAPGSEILIRLSRITTGEQAAAKAEPGRYACLRVINPSPDPDPTLAAELASRDEGVGLSYGLCEDIIASLGGFVEFESVPGHGTTFSVFLPKTTLGES